MASISVIVPTYNEANNIDKFVEVFEQLKLEDYELIFVDDYSPDGTHEKIAKLAQNNKNIRLLLRPSRQGLASAIFDGLFSATSPYLVVLDADL